MTEITDDYMRQMIAKTKHYTLVILKHGSNWNIVGADKLIWEHGRRNFRLRSQGVLPIVCPIADGSVVSGVGIFNASVEETRKIMDEDPAVQQGLFTYEAHDCRSFPGSNLP
jgi:hypothetical protein